MELYHYTSTDTMRYILENGDAFATNIRYMNDSEEYINGLRELQKLANDETLVRKWLQEKGRNDVSAEDVKQIFTDENLRLNMQDMEYYSISFCRTNDLLSQWAIYAKEAGVSIKMIFEKESYNFSTWGLGGKKAKWKCSPQKVYYFTYESMKNQHKEEYNEIACSILDELYDQEESKDPVEGKMERWKYISTFVKRYDFYQEAESRIVFHASESAETPKVEYRSEKSVLKPYLDIVCKGGWPVWEVMIGPGFNQQIVYDSVVHFLNNAKIKNGIKTADDYVKRVRAYFEPYKEELQMCDLYKSMEEHLNANRMTLKMLEPILSKIIKEICKVVDSGENWSNELREHVKRNYFTKCGIVVSKSSIPYIF